MISVIIPVFNREETICRAIDSVLAQTYKDLEIIVINDGSTDQTLEKVSTYNIEVINQQNHGVSHARNRGIERSRGDYIALLDSDDEWLPDKLKKQISVIDKCCHTNEIWIRNGVKVNQMKKHKKGGGEQFLPSLKLCCISPSSVLIHKSVFDRIGLFREDFPVCEDYDLWLKLTSLYSLDFIDEPLIRKYGGHEDQLSRKYKAMDYWRVKSIDWVLKHRELESSVRSHAILEIQKKLKILIKGYEKHQQEAKLTEVTQLYSHYFS